MIAEQWRVGEEFDIGGFLAKAWAETPETGEGSDSDGCFAVLSFHGLFNVSM